MLLSTNIWAKSWGHVRKQNVRSDRAHILEVAGMTHGCQRGDGCTSESLPENRHQGEA